MKLWTKKLADKAKKYPLYSQEGKGMDAKVLAKFFNPYGRGTWIVTEAQKQENGDWLFFGYSQSIENEWGYFMLSELESIDIEVCGYKLKLERDLHLPKDATVGDIVNK